MLYTNNTINNTVKTSNTSMTSETSAPFLMTAEAGETPASPAGAGSTGGTPSFLLQTSKADLAKLIGYVEYLGTYGKVHSRVAYASEGAFVEEIKDCLDCGIPISVCVFTDAKGKPMISTNFIGEQGCLPCGYRTEPHPANGSADIKVVAKTLTWKIPVCWSMMATIEVEAATLAEAIEIAKDDNGEIPLPDGVFQDGSWEVDCSDKDYIRQWYNNDQADLDLSEAEDGEYITEDAARDDIVAVLNNQDERWFEENWHRYKAEILANDALIDTLAAEHRRCVNRFGNDRKWSAEDACNNIGFALLELYKTGNAPKEA